MPYENSAERKKKQDYYEKYKEKQPEYQARKNKKRKQHAYDSITSGKIIDQKKWDVWCNKIKRVAANNKHSYSDNFTNDIMFKMMVQGCFYCKDVATTIDRIDSKLDHTLDNCVGCCLGCNVSKGAADSDTFIRKAYFRARGEYYDDDTDIWFVRKNKPSMSVYKRKKVPFELTEVEWDELVIGNCAYCHRRPTTWFGVDRIEPPKGYVLGNVASCCWDCNNDKSKDDVETMCARNERIAQRINSSELVIGNHEKVILHNGKKSNPVCAQGKVYENQTVASDSIDMNRTTLGRRINDGKDPGIFAITREFYEEYKDSIENITKNMFDNFV
jgi:hypothetical protein